MTGQDIIDAISELNIGEGNSIADAAELVGLDVSEDARKAMLAAGCWMHERFPTDDQRIALAGAFHIGIIIGRKLTQEQPFALSAGEELH